MNRHDSIFIAGLVVLSILTSFGIVFYAMGILTAATAPEWDKNFAYIAVGYGLGNVYILSAAWRTGAPWTDWANKLIACSFMGIYLVDMWRTGVDSGLEYLGAVCLAGVVWLNWYAVKRVCLRAAGQAGDPGTPSGRNGSRRKKSGRSK